MRKIPWLRVIACGVAVGAGSLHGIQWSAAADDPPAAKSNDASDNDDSKPAVKTKRRGKQKTIEATPTADSTKSATPIIQISTPMADAPPSEHALATALLGSLSPENMKSLGQMLDQDWKDRPEWGEMAVAILKNDFMRPGTGWWTSGSKLYDWKWLSDRFDANKDGKVEPDEFPSDLAKPDQLFERLDRDGDGQLTVADFDYTDPNPVTMFMNIPAMKGMMSNQLFNRLDKDSNGRVTMQELAEFFRYADKESLEFLTPEDLRFAIDEPRSKKREAEADDDPASAGPSTPAAALRMFLKGELGWLSSGPQLGDPAPDFTLPTHDGTANVKLADSFGKRPVVLVFGSFT